MCEQINKKNKMKKLFKFLGFKKTEKKEAEFQKEIQKENEFEKYRKYLKELEEKYNLVLFGCYRIFNSEKINILKDDNNNRKNKPYWDEFIYGIYEKLCADGECLEKFTFIPNPGKEEGREEYKVDSLETAVKYVSDYLNNKSELKKKQEEEIKLKEIEKIKTLPELKM